MEKTDGFKVTFSLTVSLAQAIRMKELAEEQKVKNVQTWVRLLIERELAK